MKRTELEQLTVKELKEIAKENNVSLSGKTKKEEIVEMLLKESAATKQEKRKAAPKAKTKAGTPDEENLQPEEAPDASPIEEPTPETAKEKLSVMGRKKSKFEAADMSLAEQAAKFYLAKSEPAFRHDVPASIPESYMCSSIKLLVRDPGTLFAYWNTGEIIIGHAKQRLSTLDGLVMVIRIVRVNDGTFYEIDVPFGASNRYIEAPNKDCPVKALLGFSNSRGEFSLILESNIVYIPAEITLQDFASKEEETLHAMSLGLSEAEMQEMQNRGYDRFRVGSEEFLRKKIQEQLSSHLVSSLSSSGLTKEKARKFRLKVDAELIIYGETEPDATVTVCGNDIELSKDGTFSFRMAFPDGNIFFPIIANASDGKEEREIDLSFNRNTESMPPRYRD